MHLNFFVHSSNNGHLDWLCSIIYSATMNIGVHMSLWIMVFSEFMGFPDGSNGKESACNAGDLGSIPGFGRSPGEGNSYPLQYSGLGNSMECIVHGVTKSWTWLSDFHFHFYFIGFISSSWILGSYGNLFPGLWRNLPYCSPQCLYQFTFSSTVQREFPFFHILSSIYCL